MAHKKYSIDYFNQYSEQKNGKCLSLKYEGYTEKLKFMCEDGHIFETQARCIVMGHWCKKCGFDRQRTSEEKVVEYVKNKGGEMLSSYKNSRTKLKIKCNKCDIIFYISYGHIKEGKWCQNCANVSRANHRRKYDVEYVDNFVKHKYSGECLSKEYFNTEEKLRFKCEKKHIFLKTFDSILYSNQWCPFCSNNTSDGEQKFREAIEGYFNIKFPKKRPGWLLNDNGNRLELDGYNDDLGIAFEYQGRQHFEVVTAFKGTKKKLEKIQRHDLIKKKLCKKNNVILLCPTYELNEFEFEEYIIKHCT